jgi:hypothetical protein
MYTFVRDDRLAVTCENTPAVLVNGLPVTAVHGPAVEVEYWTFRLPLDGRYQKVSVPGVVRSGVIR